MSIEETHNPLIPEVRQPVPVPPPPCTGFLSECVRVKFPEQHRDVEYPRCGNIGRCVLDLFDDENLT